MFYDEKQAIDACQDDPSLIFEFIRLGYFDLVESLIKSNKVDINTCDSLGNNVMMRLLKARQYDLVLEFIKKRSWDVNHQNADGDTFGHVLADDDSVSTLKILNEFLKKKNYLLNVKNNKGETLLDKAINNNYICTALKILENKDFNNINIYTFKKLCNACINKEYYGKYAKLNNLKVIIDNLEKKELIPSMEQLIDKIIDDFDEIKNAIVQKNGFRVLENIINSSIEATA